MSRFHETKKGITNSKKKKTMKKIPNSFIKARSRRRKILKKILQLVTEQSDLFLWN